jgi:hypothetical protein
MPYTRTTLGDLKSRLVQRLGSTGKFWSTHEQGDALNEALGVWQILTGDFVHTEALTLASKLSTPAPTYSAMRYIRVGTLGQMNLSELDHAENGWGSTGTALYWAPVGLELIARHPASSGSYSCTYYRGDRPLKADSDYVNLGDEELTRILDYAQAYLQFKEGPKESLQVEALKQLFVAAAQLRNAKLKTSAQYKAFMGNKG